jgi:hypothetical protein
MLCNICKIFYAANQQELCPFLKKKGSLKPWMSLFTAILNNPVPKNLSSLTNYTIEIEKRDKSIDWELKKEAAQVTYVIFSRYGRKEYISSYKDVEWGTNFVQEFFKMLLDSHLKILLSRQTFFVGTKTLNFAMKFVRCCTHIEAVMNTI